MNWRLFPWALLTCMDLLYTSQQLNYCMQKFSWCRPSSILTVLLDHSNETCIYISPKKNRKQVHKSRAYVWDNENMAGCPSAHGRFVWKWYYYKSYTSPLTHEHGLIKILGDMCRSSWISVTPITNPNLLSLFSVHFETQYPYTTVLSLILYLVFINTRPTFSFIHIYRFFPLHGTPCILNMCLVETLAYVMAALTSAQCNTTSLIYRNSIFNLISGCSFPCSATSIL